jgi:hypothetical protein
VAVFTLCEYVDAWHDRYPDVRAAWADNAKMRVAEAVRLGRIVGMTMLAQPDAEDLVHWKFDGFPLRRAKPLERISAPNWPHAERRIAEAPQVAHACPGLDRPPLSVLSAGEMSVYRWGVAMGNAVLTTCFPRRFTVGDRRALATVQTLCSAGFAPRSVPSGDDFDFRHWEPYLAVCWWIAGSCRRSLREVDQALWAANGRPRLPPLAPASASPSAGPASGNARGLGRV